MCTSKWNPGPFNSVDNFSLFCDAGDVTAQAVAQSSPGALYLSGGDVAIAVAHALGATGFQIRGRVAECVPYGHFLGGRWSRPVMTKAGGFGTDTTLLHVVNFIEEKLSV